MNKHLTKEPKEDTRKADKHVKRCSASLVIKKMQSQTIMRYHFTQIRMAAIKIFDSLKYWLLEQPEFPYTAGGKLFGYFLQR